MFVAYYPRRTVGRHLSQLVFEHNHLFRGHLPHGVRNATNSIAGFMPSGKGHPICSKGGVVVHQNRGGIQTLCRVKRRTKVFSEDARLKGDREGVGGGNGLVDVLKCIDTRKRSKHFKSRHFRIVRRIHKDGRKQSRLAVASSPTRRAPPATASSIQAATRVASPGL